jgi:hypothetical protein
VTFSGSLTDAPVTETYIAALAPQGVPTELTSEQLEPQLEAAGIDLPVLEAAVAQNFSPEDIQALLAILGEPVQLVYSISVETEFGVEPRTGAIVDLRNITNTLSARPEPTGLEEIISILGRYPDVPEAVDAVGSLEQIANGPPITVFEANYSQTPDSVSETVAQADDMAGQIALAEQTIPMVLLIAGVVLLIVAVIGLVMASRRGRDEGEGEPAGDGGDTAPAEPVTEPVADPVADTDEPVTPPAGPPDDGRTDERGPA